MNIYEFAPIRTLVTAAHWVVTHLTDLLDPIAGVGSAALAIIVLTLLVRAALLPVGVSQVKANATRQRLAPQIAELNRKHKSQPEVLQRKMMQMYAEEGASPFSGCLPVLAQMPILMAVYGLFIRPTINGQPNELLGYTLFDVPLDTGLLGQFSAGTLTPGSALLFGAIMVAIAAVAQITRRTLTPPAATGATTAPGVPNTAGMTKVLSYLPFMTAVIAAVVPLAAALYLLTTTTWTLAERLVLNRRYL